MHVRNRSLAIAFGVLAACAAVLPAGESPPCERPLDVETLGNVVLESATSARPGESAWFTLGVWECCVFLTAIPACVEWSVEPAEFGVLELEEILEPSQFGRSGLLTIAPETPHGTVFRITANVENGARVLSTTVHAYRPEANPLVGYWRESEQTLCAPTFIRGDVDGSGVLDVSDPIAMLCFFFLGCDELPCEKARDVNADGEANLADPVTLLNFLFLGGRPPAAPFPDCGPEPVATARSCRASLCPWAPASTRAPEQRIEELVFEADGTFRVTWTPFEVYVDYWGTYTFDLDTGGLRLEVAGGNFVPSDVDGSGSFEISNEGLVLRDIWLGDRESPLPPRVGCGHTFQAR